MSAQIDPKVLTALFQLTKAMHRDVYPPIDPKKLAPFASNKVILITGSGGGLGYVGLLSVIKWKHSLTLSGRREDLD
ncbi:hypothetical protein PMIN02_003284 [Paraphaeosphaeria minitans]|uniref:Uncharacterized protein n=1 Tax=Paraphaeosphaeria minitans TaxID=565426 RepID=A0A9P6GBT1_9PLEO|nr:hypothetical protein PMIN01_09515 [Paraphaeosphaeria minitans]